MIARIPRAPPLLTAARLRVHYVNPTSISRNYAQKIKHKPSHTATTRSAPPPPPAPPSSIKTTSTTTPAPSVQATGSFTGAPPPSTEEKPRISLVPKAKTQQTPKQKNNTSKNAKTINSRDEELNQLDVLERTIQMQRAHPASDIWSQQAQLMDLHIPNRHHLKRFFRTVRSIAQLRAWWNALLADVENWAKNAVSMQKMAKHNAFPGIDVSSAWSLQVLRFRSTRKNAWVTGLRRLAFATYVGINEALASNDISTLKALTSSTYQSDILRLIRKRDPSLHYTWSITSNSGTTLPESTPTRTVTLEKLISGACTHVPIPPHVRVRPLSIRATEGYLDRTAPRIGNRLLVQMLVEVTSWQHLEIYDKTGQLVHSTVKSVTNTSSPSRDSPSSLPQPKHVTEYLVFEKTMWYDSPWVVREQMYSAKS